MHRERPWLRGISSRAPWPASRLRPRWLGPPVSAPRRPGGCTQVGRTNGQMDEPLGRKHFEGWTPDRRTPAGEAQGRRASLTPNSSPLSTRKLPRHPELLCTPKVHGEGRPLPSPHAEPKLPRGSERPAGMSVCVSLAPTNALSALPRGPLPPAPRCSSQSQALTMRHKALRVPSDSGYQHLLARPPVSPAKAWHPRPSSLSLPASPEAAAGSVPSPRSRSRCPPPASA